ncbi:uracil-DNA glycosylase family protein [uncultured Novosphingobium sp.]|uniref:uracil-DNA glycosylase family protein n=1 Tax=uncultured Novosphingobium sp. TaxID=292277 RepID=UPI00374A16E4
MTVSLDELLQQIRACRVCEQALGFEPRPFVAASPTARLLIIGQAPGSRVHATGLGWQDASGDRLRDWLGIDNATFYDTARIAQMPTGFCYPGKGQGGDLPPRPECAPLWHKPLLARLPKVRLTLLVGLHAQKLYLPKRFAPNMTEAVRRWQEAPDGLFPLPHPAWRSRLWMANNPWFEADVLPRLRQQVQAVIA